tara:strand:- start:3777 stop:4409 length:633 start_codon:yes stop_codon:yes gene_type:complete
MDKNKLIQKLNLENLLTISAALQKQKCFIFYGTLLGIIREKNILNGDDDIDILINIKIKKKVLEIIKKIKIFNINKKVTNNNFIQLIRKENKVKTFVDLYFYVDNPKNKYIIEKHNFLSSVNLKSHALHIPKNLIFPIKQSQKFKNVFLPNKALKLCSFLYGKSWRKPLKKNTGYRMEIVDHKPKLIKRSKLGGITRSIKQLFKNEFKKN